MSRVIWFIAVLIFFGPLGCTRMLVPLCPKLAEQSFDPPRPGTAVNRYLQAEADHRHVKIHVLSPFVGELEGMPWDISWFRQRYVYIVCGFDPHNVIEDRSICLECLARANKWLALIQSRAPEDLFLKETDYVPLCVP